MAKAKYTLIGKPATRAFRIVWAMEEMGLDYEIINSGPHEGAILAVNPSGKVPALIDHRKEDAVIVDSVAAIQYLADKHKKLTHKAGTIERARQDSFTQFACDDMDGILWTVAKHTFILPEELRCKVPVKMAALWDFERAMRAFSERLGDRQYVMGDEISVPDLVIGHCGGWAARAGFDVPEGNITEYFSRLVARPAFQRANELRVA